MIVDGIGGADGARASSLQETNVRGLCRAPRTGGVWQEGLAKARRKKWSNPWWRRFNPTTSCLEAENAKKLKQVPPLCRLGDNADAFKGRVSDVGGQALGEYVQHTGYRRLRSRPDDGPDEIVDNKCEMNAGIAENLQHGWGLLARAEAGLEGCLDEAGLAALPGWPLIH